MLWIVSPGFLIGWLCIALSCDIRTLCIGRFITGIISCISFTVVGLYLPEISSTAARGFITCFGSTGFAIGTLSSFILGTFVDYRGLAFINIVFVMVMFICLTCIPESPLWLVGKERLYTALQSLKWLRRHSKSIDNEIIELLTQTRENLDIQSLFSNINKKSVLMPLFICLCLQFNQQFCAVNAVTFYSSDIFLETGLDINPDICGIILILVQSAFLILFAFKIDIWGRKFLFLLSNVTMFFSLVGLGTFYLLEFYINGSLPWLPLVCLCTFEVGFSSGIAILPSTLTGEVLPLELRSFCCGICMGFNSLCLFLVTNFFPIMGETFGKGGTFFFFSVNCFLCSFLYLWLPETKGKSLQEIQAHFLKD